jgi:hypothetical protein
MNYDCGTFLKIYDLIAASPVLWLSFLFSAELFVLPGNERVLTGHRLFARP